MNNGNGAGAPSRWETLARLYAGGGASDDELARLAILLQDTYDLGCKDGALEVIDRLREDTASVRAQILKAAALFSDYVKATRTTDA